MGRLFAAVDTSLADKLAGYDAATYERMVDGLNLPGGQPPGASYGIAANAAATHLAVTHATTPFASVYNMDTWAKETLAGTVPAQGNAAAFQPSGAYLAIAHNTTPYLTVFNATTWAKVTPGGGNPTGNGTGVAWRPDGARLAVGHATSPYLTVYDTSGAPTAWSKIAGIPSPGSQVYGVAWSPDGAYLVCKTLSTPFVVIYDTATWTQITTGATPTAASQPCAFRPSGSHLVLGDASRILVLRTSDWAAETISLGWTGTVYSFAFDGDRLIVGGTLSQSFIEYNMTDWTYTTHGSSGVGPTMRSIVHVAGSARRLGTSGADVVRDDTGAPAARAVRIYHRDSGALLAATASDAAGQYSVPFFSAQEVQSVFCDDTAGTVFNDKIVRARPA